MKNNSVSKIPCSLEKFFQYWLWFTIPLHKLSPKEIEVLAAILKKRYELSLIINDDDSIDRFLFSREVKKELSEELGLEKGNTFNMICSRLRIKGIILEGNKLNKKVVPNMSRGTDKFDFTIVFEIRDNVKEKNKTSS